MLFCRAVLLSIGLGAQAYAPIQMVSHGIKGLAVLPEGFPRNVQDSVIPQQLVISNTVDSIPSSRIPYFTARPDQTITWDDMDWCLEADGDHRGAVARVNTCNGGAAQKWNWIPNGRGSNMLQLQDTKMCLDVRDGHGLDGAPIVLRDCENSATETWAFEDVMAGISESTARASDMRYVMLSCFALAGVGLGALIWRLQPKARMLAATPGGDGGVALTAPAAVPPTSRSGNISMSAPAARPGFHPLTGDPEVWRTTSNAPAPEKKGGGAAQDFLEFEPYYDNKTMPMNTAKPKAPFTGKVISVDKIVGPNATGETYDIVIDHEGKLPFIEGQSFGVIAPGVDPKTGKPAKVRLYSIASSRYGDDMAGTTTTLCVRRATYWCPELKAEDPAKKGVCSNFLCDAKAGDTVQMTGPTGKALLLPESNPETDIIMVATGTGIAPFRSFLRRMFIEKTPYGKDFKGLAWLFLGVANTDSLLYDDCWKKIAEEDPKRFRYDVALSREQKNKDGGKMYIQDKVEEYADEIFDRLDKGAHMYFCGLRGMMPGIQDMLKKVAERKGLDIDEFTKNLKSKGQWHVEVY